MFRKGQNIRTLILAEKPKLIEKWQPHMNGKDEMTNINTIKSKLNQNIIKNIVPNYIYL